MRPFQAFRFVSSRNRLSSGVDLLLRAFNQRITSSFLSGLNQLQEQQAHQLLIRQSRTFVAQWNRRSQGIQTLAGLKSRKPLVERTLRQVGAQLAQAEMQAAVAEARARNNIQDSLSGTERRLILQGERQVFLYRSRSRQRLDCWSKVWRLRLRRVIYFCLIFQNLVAVDQ